MSESELRPERLAFQGLFQQERGCDVEFVVGPPDGETWRLTAHRKVLAACSPVLKAMLAGSFPQGNGEPIFICDIEPRAFHCLLMYAYGLTPKFQTVITALSTLAASHKYMCPGLEWESAAFLNEQVQTRPDIALEVFQTTSFYCQSQDVWEPTAPPAEEMDSGEDSEDSRLMDSPRRQSLMHAEGRRRSHADWHLCLGEASRRLSHNCLQTIDKHADDVLSLEQLEDLNLESLLAVFSRDTFVVSSEVSIFIAAERWAECECKRLKLPHSNEHLRQALGGTSIICSGKVARLLLLTPQEFADGPARSPLLTAEEQKTLLVHLVGGSPSLREAHLSPAKHMNWTRLASPRVLSPPVYLPISSQQTQGRCEGSPCKSSKSRCWRWRWPCKKKKKTKAPKVETSKKEAAKKEAPPEVEPLDSSEKPVCGSKTCDFLIGVIACLFD